MQTGKNIYEMDMHLIKALPNSNKRNSDQGASMARGLRLSKNLSGLEISLRLQPEKYLILLRSLIPDHQFGCPGQISVRNYPKKVNSTGNIFQNNLMFGDRGLESFGIDH